MSETFLQPEIISVKQLLDISNLRIPEYQRPYKWTEKNVNQLIDDIRDNLDKSAYRIGTLVIHNNKEEGALDIVDGQQRTITLFLLALRIYPIIENNKDLQRHVFLRDDSLESFKPKSKFSFSNLITKQNIQKNFKAMERRNSDLEDWNFLKFFFNQCEFVKVVIDDVSEAFQFFDSQNARGKDLEPHDLLKAYHLREMNCSSTEQDRLNAVKEWENMDTNELSSLFSQYLYRIKNWGRDRSARYFTKDDVDAFKGISPNLEERFPYTKIYRIAHYYVDEFNSSCHSKILHESFGFPFQIDQVIINGKRFFEYVSYYARMREEIEKDRSFDVLHLVNNHMSHGRTGDGYVRNLFYCALMAYIDKFGKEYLSRVVEKIFTWAYTLRLKLYSVDIESADNYALNWGHAKFPMFKLIRDAGRPQEILNVELDILHECRATKEDDIIAKLSKLGYYV